MSKFIDGIKKTGFILENSIVQQLKQNNWNIISNKYYEDDVLESVREIDVLAYKVFKVDDLFIYTTLIISCKKNDNNAWALVSRDIDLNEPNSNWWPLHIWSNDYATKQVLLRENANKDYYKYMFEENGIIVMGPPSVDIFAFQELNKETGRPQNDKNIFSSITTLMKAQSYEMGALNTRKRNKCIYQFNLISIIDSNLIRLHVDGDEINEEDIDSEQMVARYIIKKQEQFFRIRFLKADSFEEYIKSYNQLHSSNVKLVKRERDSWLDNSIKDHKKVSLLTNEFIESILESIIDASRYYLNKQFVKESLFLYWESNKNFLRIFVTEDEKICGYLKSDKTLQEKTKSVLKELFKFEGSFEYSTDSLPF